MRCYGYRFREVMDLPMHIFSLLQRNIDRMTAEDDYRMARTVALGFSGGDGLSDLFEQLRKQMGSAVVYEDDDGEVPEKLHRVLEMEFDEEGLHALKGMGRV